MVAQSISLAPPLSKPAASGMRPQGLGSGTLLRSVFGLRPVEGLGQGDLLLDASGRMVVLRSVRRVRAEADDLVRITPCDTVPGLERALIVGAGQKLTIRDWRTEILFGQGALASAARLVDGQHARRLRMPRMLYQLCLDDDRVIEANGLPVLVRASSQAAQNRRQRVGQVFCNQTWADLSRGLDMQPCSRRRGLGGWQATRHQPGNQPGQHIA